MNLFKTNNRKILCFTKNELSELFENSKKLELVEEIENRNLSTEDLRNNPQKMFKIAKIISDNTSQHRDNHEIFAGLFVFSDFYDKHSEICFELKNEFKQDRDKIFSLNDLNKYRLGGPPDFIIKSGDGLREFEMKRYRNDLNTNTIFDFIKKKVEHYCNDLGDMNLLIVLQSEPFNILNIDFKILFENIKDLNFNFKGQILISYNENNEDVVINQVYPSLTTSRIPTQLPSTKNQFPRF